MSQTAPQSGRNRNTTLFGWQGITLRVPEDWYPAALGTDRKTGYLRVQNADGHAVEVKWFTPKGTVDMERELTKYRTTLERAARKRKAAFEWKAKPKVAFRESKPDKNRRFFGWVGEAQALGAIWYCRTCARVVIAQVAMPNSDDAALQAAILSSIEDHGEEGRETWSLYGLTLEVPEAWALDKHQLMAGYTMLQFRQRDHILRAERWALANLALKGASLQEYLLGKSRKFWKDFSLSAGDLEVHGHAGTQFEGRTRKVWMRLIGPIAALFKRPLADRISVKAWHCDTENKLFAIHSVHAAGETELIEAAVSAVTCH